MRDQSQRWPGLSSCRLLGRVGAAGTEGTFAWKGLEPGMAGRTSPLFRVSCCANATMGVRGRGMECQGLANVTEIERALPASHKVLPLLLLR